MDASFTAEQDEIRRTLRELLQKRCGSQESRTAVDTPAGHDPALWTVLARQLGLPGLALPEAYGGVGCTATELALAAEETGRFVAPSPLLATAVLAAPLVLALGTETQRARLLPRIAAGSLTAALAVPGTVLTTALTLTAPNAGEWAGGGRAGGVQARQVGDSGWRLYGQVAQVLDGHSAELLLVAAHAGASPGRGHCCSWWRGMLSGSCAYGRPPSTRPGLRLGSNYGMSKPSCSAPTTVRTSYGSFPPPVTPSPPYSPPKPSEPPTGPWSGPFNTSSSVSSSGGPSGPSRR